MKAKLKPLDGKYYGTVVEFERKPGEMVGQAWFWINTGEPSIRELKSRGYNAKQWKENAWVDNGFGGTSRIRDMDITSDNHYESKDSYNAAKKLVKVFNGKRG